MSRFKAGDILKNLSNDILYTVVSGETDSVGAIQVKRVNNDGKFTWDFVYAKDNVKLISQRVTIGKITWEIEPEQRVPDVGDYILIEKDSNSPMILSVSAKIDKPYWIVNQVL